MSSQSAHDIYKLLYSVFAERKAEEVFEIEILSPEQGLLLRDGSCIGITKAALAKAFIVARQHFTKYLNHCGRSTNLDISISPRTRSGEFDQDDQDLATITEIILLFDCEHITACNWRKRFIFALKEQLDTKHDFRTLEKTLERERNLMTSFLCSPLHRHTKSPTLWQHRLWIFTELLDLKRQGSTEPKHYGHSKGSGFPVVEVLRGLVLEELDVVCKAGQLHPRNYYAFSYMRQIYTLIQQNCLSLKEDESPENNKSNLPIVLCLEVIEPMLKWCLSNPSDISGWMYLFYTLDLDDSRINYPSDIQLEKLGDKRRIVMDRVIHFAVHVAAWEGESLWTFMNLMITRFGFDILPAMDKPDSNTTLRPNFTNVPHSARRWQTTRDDIRRKYDQRQDW